MPQRAGRVKVLTGPAPSASDEPVGVPLPDAELAYVGQIPLGCEPGELLGKLIRDVGWRQEHITMFGRTLRQPRLVAWYGDAQARYAYSGTVLEPVPWTGMLSSLRDAVEQAAGGRFNSVLLNYYRDGNDAMGLHADDEPELGPAPVIASLSLGATRTLYFRHRTRRDLATFNLSLPSGSLLVMRGTTQQYWKHGLRRVSRPCGPRVNLTFRRIITSGC